MEADLRRYKLFSVPLFLIGSMLIGVAAYVHLAIFDYAHCFGVSGLIAAVNGFIAFGAIYLVLGLFCCCYPNIRTSFESVAVVCVVSSVFTVCASGYVYFSVIQGTTVDIITNKMREDLDDFDSKDDQFKDITDTWNSVQADFECCGIDSYQDWVETVYGKAVKGVPDSCCKNHAPWNHAADCGRDVFNKKGVRGINRRGCSKLLEEFIEGQMTIIEGMGIAIVVLCVISVALLPATGVHKEYQSLQ